MIVEKASSVTDGTGIDRTNSKTVTEVDNDEASTGVGDASEVLIDPILEKRVLRRLDKRFAPLFCALYFFGESMLFVLARQQISGEIVR